MTVLMEPGPLEVGHGGFCNSRIKQGPRRCRKTAGWGTGHKGVGACKLHGGATPNHQKAAERQILWGSIRELVEHHRPGTVDPIAGLLEVVADTWAMRRALWHLVGGLVPEGGHAYTEVLDPDDDGDGRPLLEYVPATPAGLWSPDHKGDARPHVLIAMLHEATRDHLQACRYALDAGIAERQVRLAEETAERIAGVLRAMATGVLELLAAAGAEAGMRREVETGLPAVMRTALEQARTIDTTSEEN